MFIIYYHTKFHIFNSCDPLLIAIKLKAKWAFRMAATWFHSLQKIHPNKSCLYFAGLLSCINFGPYIK